MGTRTIGWVRCLAVSSMPKTRKRPQARGRHGELRGSSHAVRSRGNKRVADGGGKSKAAVELGRKGGIARAKSISKARRTAIARKGANARWRKAKSRTKRRG